MPNLTFKTAFVIMWLLWMMLVWWVCMPWWICQRENWRGRCSLDILMWVLGVQTSWWWLQVKCLYPLSHYSDSVHWLIYWFWDLVLLCKSDWYGSPCPYLSLTSVEIKGRCHHTLLGWGPFWWGKELPWKVWLGGYLRNQKKLITECARNDV